MLHETGVAYLTTGDVGELARTLLSPERERPVVAITTPHGSREPILDSQRVVNSLGSLADVVIIETGDATWALAAALPPRLEVYDGAARIWFPGLTKKSNPRDHPLLFVKSHEDLETVPTRLVGIVAGGAGNSRPDRNDAEQQVLRARVTEVASTHLLLEINGQQGTLRRSGLPLEDLLGSALVGQELPVRTTERILQGLCEYTAEGLLPTPLERIHAVAPVGSVVWARVKGFRRHGVLAEVLPAVVGYVPIGHIDYTFVEDPHDYLRLGEWIGVRVIENRACTTRLTLSVKEALGEEPRAISLLEGGRTYEPRGDDRVGGDPARDIAPNSLGGENGAGKEALRNREKELEEERRRNSVLKKDNSVLKKKLRSLEDSKGGPKRRRQVERLTEKAFLRAVREKYAELYDEDDRAAHPLRCMIVGPKFLKSLEETEGVDLEKVVEVCAHVAAGRGHAFTGRNLHPLRTGRRGSPQMVRSSDNAKAWRCAIQRGTPSARRLHLWIIPGPQGPTYEFGKVGVHDDYDMPG